MYGTVTKMSVSQTLVPYVRAGKHVQSYPLSKLTFFQTAGLAILN